MATAVINPLQVRLGNLVREATVLRNSRKRDLKAVRKVEMKIDRLRQQLRYGGTNWALTS